MSDVRRISSRRAWAIASVLVITAASSTLSGDDRIPERTLQVVSFRATCERCLPVATQLEVVFDAAVDPNAAAYLIESEPHVTLLPLGTGPSRRIVLEGDFEPRTAYRFSVPEGLVGGDGSRTAESHDLELRTGGGSPNVQMPQGETVLGPGRGLPMLIESVDSARLRVIPLRAADLAAASEITGYHPPGRDPIAMLPSAFQGRVRTHAIDEAEADVEGRLEVDPFAIAGGSPVLAVLDAPGAAASASIVQRGGRAVTLKVGASSGLVWVTDVARGVPVAGASVVVQEGERVRFRGRTDADGLLRLPAESDLQTTSEEPWSRPPLRAVVEHGGELDYATERFSTGLESWQFGLPYAYFGGSESIRGMVTAERGIYRPGETVHLLGVLRRLGRDGRLVPPRGQVSVELRDPDGTAVLTRNVRLTAYGTFRMDAPIAEGARLGRFQVVVRKGEAALTHRFEVGEYRGNTFEVELPGAGAIETDGGSVVVPVRARYLYGAPVRNASLQWSVSHRPHRVTFPGAEGFSFGDPRGNGGTTWLTSGDLELDEEGSGRIELPLSALPEEGEAQALDLIFEATVTDAADDVVTGRTVQTLTPRDTIAGVASDRWVVRAEEGWNVRVLAVDPEGRTVSGRDLELRLYHRQWMSAAQGASRARYYGHWEDVLVETRQVQSGSRPTDVRLPLGEGGSYRVVVSPEGTEAGAVAHVWAYGHGGTAPIDNDPRMELMLDRENYRPGDTAQVFAQSPWGESLALVTVERDGVLSARTLRLRGNETPIEVEVDGRFVPNVFVGVTVVPMGLGTASPVAGVPMRTGYRELRVNTDERRLRVEVTPASDGYRPGEEADVNVRVLDHGGRPVRAEVTLWAADEGVLQLTGYQTPDPFAPAYAQHRHQVGNASNLTRWTRLDPDFWYEGGGDGGEEEDGAAALRSRFLSTAFFSRGVVTNADGRARVRVSLPDNLTRWRVMAAVADRGQRFGKGEASFTTSKPLQVTPALPRFVTQGDLIDAGVVVHNHTGADGVAEVRLEIEGAELAGEPVVRVEVPEGGQRAVRFPVLARDVGEVRIDARVSMGGERDGFRISLPAHAPSAWSSDQLGDGRVDGVATVPVRMPAQLTPGLAELVVTVSPSLFASMERGLESLIEYPNGCVEQTTSRLIPMVLLEDLMENMGSDTLSGEEHRRKMRAAIQHVLEHQNHDGGFGLWPTSDSEGFLTAYALWGLLTARDHGYAVQERDVTRAVTYLQRHATHGDDMHGQFSNDEVAPFSAYVLAYASQRDGGLSAELAGRQEQLTRFGVGLLANALTRREGASADPLFAALAGARQSVGGGALVREGAGSRELMHYGRDVRATSSTVQAMVADGRVDDAEDLVAGILEQRSPDGSWGTTYNNMWALYALTSYAEAVDRAPATVPVRVTLGGEEVATLRITPSARAKQIVIPVDRLPAAGGHASLSVEAPSEAGIRYSARLRYVERSRTQRAVDRGFRVERALFDAESGARVVHPTVGQLLRVRLTLHTPQARRQVALTDSLPAGLEPVDTSLATSQRRVTAEGTGWHWTWRELHDERVAFFADHLPAGEHVAEYLARASRSGEFVRPAARAEEMYDPNVWGRGAIEQVTVRRP